MMSLIFFIIKTVRGIIGNTHGVNNAKKPPRKPRMIRSIKLLPDEIMSED